MTQTGSRGGRRWAIRLVAGLVLVAAAAVLFVYDIPSGLVWGYMLQGALLILGVVSVCEALRRRFALGDGGAETP